MNIIGIVLGWIEPTDHALICWHAWLTCVLLLTQLTCGLRCLPQPSNLA